MVHLKSAHTTVALSPTSMGESLEKVFLKHFPHSYVKAIGDTTVRFGSMSLVLQYALGKDKSEWPNGFFENDPMSNKIMIDGFSGDGDPSVKLDVKSLMNYGIFVKPAPDSNYAHDKIKLWTRNFSATESKVVANLDKFFAALRKAVEENLDRLPDIAKSKV